MDNNSYIDAVKRNNKRIYLIAFSYLKNQHDAEDVVHYDIQFENDGVEWSSDSDVNISVDNFQEPTTSVQK